MSVTTLVRREFRNARQSRVLWIFLAVFMLLPASVFYLYTSVPAAVGPPDPTGTTSVDLLAFLVFPVTFVLPLAGILLGFDAIAGERDRGSLKLVLSFPHTRRDVLIAKILSRTILIGLAIVTSFSIAGGVAALTLGTLSFVDYLLFMLLTTLFGLAYVCLAVSASAMTHSRTLAVALLGGFYLVFLLWHTVPPTVVWVLHGFSQPPVSPFWVGVVDFLEQINPAVAYQTALTAYVPGFGNSSPTGEPFSLRPWTSILFLVGWCFVPALVGYRRFQRAEL